MIHPQANNCLVVRHTVLMNAPILAMPPHAVGLHPNKSVFPSTFIQQSGDAYGRMLKVLDRLAIDLHIHTGCICAYVFNYHPLYLVDWPAVTYPV